MPGKKIKTKIHNLHLLMKKKIKWVIKLYGSEVIKAHFFLLV